jgi:(E)-4-hydroxy-3-methylbut-2-enyl-diphosphate synthase
VAIALVNRYKERNNSKKIAPINGLGKNPFESLRRETFEVASIGGSTVPKVVADYSRCTIEKYSDLLPAGHAYKADLDKWTVTDMGADILYAGKSILPFDPPNSLKVVYDYCAWKTLDDRTKGFPFFSMEEYASPEQKSFVVNFVRVQIEDLSGNQFTKIQNDDKVVFVLETGNENGMAEQRRFFLELLERKINNPVIIKRSYKDLDNELLRLYSSTDFGALFLEGFGDGVWINTEASITGQNSLEFINRTLFGILQAVRVRISKAEYIACPSCGRTLFDLVEVTNKIRNRTGHLKGVKIAIMGCIVNGPGEMADADFGYVGSGPGKITLYKGKEIVKRSIGAEFAVNELILLIKESGMWIDKD